MKAGAGDFQTRSAQKEKRHRKTFSSTCSLLAKFYGSFCNSAPQTFSQAPISQTPFSAYPKPPPLPPPHMQSNKKTADRLHASCKLLGVHFGDKAETSWSPVNCRGKAKLGLDSGAKIQTYTQSYQYPLQFAKWQLFHVCLSLLKLEVQGGIVAQGGKKWKT